MLKLKTDMIQKSDIFQTFDIPLLNYDTGSESFEKRIKILQKYNRNN